MTKISVRRLPKDPGPAGWNRILPDPPPPEVLDTEMTADWLVVGAGFAGLAAARRLSQLCPGERVVVLDATRIGDGPAGRNSGFMIDLPHDLSSPSYGGDLEANRREIADNRAGIAFARKMAEDFGLGQDVFDTCGKVNAAATSRGLDNNRIYAAHVRALGETCREIDAAGMAEMTGSTYYKGGLLTPGVAVIQPAAYVRGVAQGLRSNRVAIYENSPVTALERADGSWRARTPRGRVSAPRVILAVNGHLNSFGFLKNRLMHVFTYASMTRALTTAEVTALGGKTSWGITSADPLGSSVRRISGVGGDRILVRNRFTYDPTMEVTDARIARVAQDHDRAFLRRFPSLKGVSMEYRWGGRLCLSLNNVQVVRELEDGLFAACCQNGLGTVKGTLAGVRAAELATGQEPGTARSAGTELLPKRLPPQAISKVGANVRLRWGEWRAGREL